MLKSKWINLISILLIVIALIFAFFMLFKPENISNNSAKTFKYENGQSINIETNDYYSDYKKEKSSKIVLNGNSAASDSANVEINGTEININGGGIYEISGSLENGNIKVNANDDLAVKLVMCNANITSNTSYAIYIENAEKTIISLPDNTENSFTGMDTVSNNIDSVIYSKDDITINGNGFITVDGKCGDAIKSNDSIKILGGNIVLNAVDEAICANDYILMFDGNVTIKSASDAIKCENSDDENLGFISLEGGNLDINSNDDGIYAGSDFYINDTTATLTVGDDAIRAKNFLHLNGGKIEILSSYEGMEAAYININDGEYCIFSTDDAINATGTNDTQPYPGRPGMKVNGEVYLKINGGKIYAEVGGDGIDSNAAAEINGGYIEIYGPENNGNSTLDFDGGYIINGGTVIAAGSSGMAETPNDISSQTSITIILSKTYNRKSNFMLKNNLGEVVISGTSNKSFDWILLTSNQIKVGETYTFCINDVEVNSITVSENVTKLGEENNFNKRRFFN